MIRGISVACMMVAVGAVEAAPVDLLPATPVLVLKGAEASAGRLETLESGGTRVTTVRKPPYPWNVSLPVATNAPFAAGDTLQVVFSARKLASSHETGEAQIDCVVEETSGDHRKLAESSHSFTSEWAEVTVPFRADKAAAAGAAQVALRFGFAPQAVEVRGLRLVNHGPGTDPASLPKTVRRYPGFEADAAWRAEAERRIEHIRKAGLTVEVVDQAGRPVPDARVRVVLERHAFALGTCVTAKRILGTTPDDVRYRETLVRHFNKAVFENDLKWEPWEMGGDVHCERAIDTIRWLRNHGLSVRGHVIVWPSWRASPPWLTALKADPQSLRRTIEDHVAGQTKTLCGLLDEWDVVNENYAHTDFTDLLGREAMADWFRIAGRETPGTRLFYNDYVMFQGDGPGSPSDALFTILSELKASGAPLGGIGEQAHFGGNPPGPDEVLAKFDRFATLGLPIQITEFDIDTADTDLQTAYTRDFLTTVFSHPAITGVICWGFWEGTHWKPRAAFWDGQWNLRPNGRVWLDLFEKQWTTDDTLAADASGRCTARPFKGRVRIEATAGERRATETIELADDRTVRLVVRP